MEKIFYNNTLIAIRTKRFKKGIIPLTDPLQSLQVVIHKRKVSSYTKAHMHKSVERVTQNLQECLVVIKGKMKIDLFASDNKFFKSIYVSAGQTVIFISGGHAVRILEDAELIEVKNGPFIEDKVFIE